MRKELGDDQVRVTVRLPRGLYDDLLAVGRERFGPWRGPGTMRLGNVAGMSALWEPQNA